MTRPGNLGINPLILGPNGQKLNLDNGERSGQVWTVIQVEG